MGRYIGLVLLDGTEHPEFPMDKFSGISEMLELMGDVPMRKSREPSWDNPEYFTQPIDHDRFATQPVPEINQELWQRFVDILSSDPDYWINFSY